MTAPTDAGFRLGWRASALACATFLATFANAGGSARAAGEQRLATINICIKTEEARKGSIRFVQTKRRCVRGEQITRVVSAPETQIVQGTGGEKSERGDPGPTGPAGPAGPIGATGPTGPTGSSGAAGATGPTGPTGLQGDVGATGPPGAQGATGAQGEHGSTGPQGPTGAQGPAGEVGATGPQGSPGATGPTGEQGPPGPTGSGLWAVVSATGSLARGSGVTAVSGPTSNVFTVEFGQNVTGCAYLAVPGETGTATPGSEPLGFAVPTGHASNAKAVRVKTYDKGGSVANRAFHLTVAC